MIYDNLVTYRRNLWNHVLRNLLVKGGVVTREQLSEAQKRERRTLPVSSKKSFDWGITSEETLSAFLAKQFGIETVELVPGEIEDAVFALVPPQIIQKHQLIPL